MTGCWCYMSCLFEAIFEHASPALANGYDLFKNFCCVLFFQEGHEFGTTAACSTRHGRR